jgi:hypothetical protein
MRLFRLLDLDRVKISSVGRSPTARPDRFKQSIQNLVSACEVSASGLQHLHSQPKSPRY